MVFATDNYSTSLNFKPPRAMRQIKRFHRQLLLLCCLFVQLLACKLMPKEPSAKEDSKKFSQFLSDYYNGRMRLSPLEATLNGDSRYNDQLPADFADSYRDTLKSFYTGFNEALSKYDRSTLSDDDGLSYEKSRRPKKASKRFSLQGEPVVTKN